MMMFFNIFIRMSFLHQLISDLIVSHLLIKYFLWIIKED